MLAQVIVARKVLLMSMFQLYDPLFAVLLATGLVMISLGIHIFARPFEDAGTNWVEMLTLTSQLFLLVAGPVFKTLVRDRHTRRACRPREDVGTHERRRRVDRTILTTAWKAEWRPRCARALSLSAPQRLSWYGAHLRPRTLRLRPLTCAATCPGTLAVDSDAGQRVARGAYDGRRPRTRRLQGAQASLPASNSRAT